MRVWGEMRESIVSGENLVLKSTVTTKLFSNEITLNDTIVNEVFECENITLCYHFNFGYPLVRDGSAITNVPDDVSHIYALVHGIEE